MYKREYPLCKKVMFQMETGGAGVAAGAGYSQAAAVPEPTPHNRPESADERMRRFLEQRVRLQPGIAHLLHTRVAAQEVGDDLRHVAHLSPSLATHPFGKHVQLDKGKGTAPLPL